MNEDVNVEGIKTPQPEDQHNAFTALLLEKSPQPQNFPLSVIAISLHLVKLYNYQSTIITAYVTRYVHI